MVVVQWCIGFALCWRVVRLVAGTPQQERAVSVIVPARNEALVLPELLGRLQAQTCPPHELIVVDDHSSDGTAACAQEFGVTVIAGAPLPVGWTGKAWACAQGAERATGDVLVFLDADTEPEPQLLEWLVARQEQCGGLISVQPYHRTGRVVEKLSAFFNLIAVMATGLGSINPRAKRTGAFGACLATSAADYEQAGGHEAARASVLEDVALANAYASAGLPVDTTTGRKSIAFRMYPMGVRQMVEGWGKNFASGAGTTPPVRFVFVFAWVTACVSLSIGAVVAIVQAVADGAAPGWFYAAAYGAFALQLFFMLRQVGTFGAGTALLFPVFVFAFLLVFVWSSINTLVRREVQWKGRAISTRNARSPS